MIRHSSQLAAIVALTLTSGALHAAPLEATALYAEKTHACRTLDLATWSHPTRQVMESQRVDIQKVELCNGGVYPIFTVALPGEPLVRINDAFFNKLYVRMVAANGYHSFAFVDAGRGVIVYVEAKGRKAIETNYDEFDAAPTK
ncbi:MAG: hypothetical protein KDJ25_08450 [Rhodoblastus sp.]|nr:hypothetical protein [Rhodoblastus sp.]